MRQKLIGGGVESGVGLATEDCISSEEAPQKLYLKNYLNALSGVHRLISLKPKFGSFKWICS